MMADQKATTAAAMDELVGILKGIEAERLQELKGMLGRFPLENYRDVKARVDNPPPGRYAAPETALAREWDKKKALADYDKSWIERVASCTKDIYISRMMQAVISEYNGKWASRERLSALDIEVKEGLYQSFGINSWSGLFGVGDKLRHANPAIDISRRAFIGGAGSYAINQVLKGTPLETSDFDAIVYWGALPKAVWGAWDWGNNVRPMANAVDKMTAEGLYQTLEMVKDLATRGAVEMCAELQRARSAVPQTKAR